jgi:hypothetical protein
MEMYSASHPHDGEIALKDEVLNRLLGTAQVDGGLFHVQENRLNFGRGEAGKL